MEKFLKNLYKKNSKNIQAYTNKIWSELEDVDFITVADMESRRYSHRDPQYIGEILTPTTSPPHLSPDRFVR